MSKIDLYKNLDTYIKASKVLTLKELITTAADDILIFFNHFVFLKIRLVVSSESYARHEMPNLIFSENIDKKNRLSSATISEYLGQIWKSIEETDQCQFLNFLPRSSLAILYKISHV